MRLCQDQRCPSYGFDATPGCVVWEHSRILDARETWRRRLDDETVADAARRVERIEDAISDLKVYAPQLLA